MCGVDLTTMQQLLADQRRDLITDIKEQIASEVATQLASHTARLDQLQHDQIMLRKQLSDISSQLNHNLTLSSSDHGNIQPSPSPCPGPAPGDLTMQRSPNCHSLVPAETIPCSETIQAKLVRQQAPSEECGEPLSELEKAKRTLSFYPVIPDLPNHSSSDNGPCHTMLYSALHSFLRTNMAMPSSAIPNLQDCDISPHPNSDKITVTFPTSVEVKTIFRYVRNLSPGQKVSLHIPPNLVSSYSDLQNRAYKLRHDEIPKKTVIRYWGDSLALFARQPGDIRWVHVHSCPSVKPTGLDLESIEPDPKN